MVPIHDTDVAQERWARAEWENYELWEKVELRLKKHKRRWVLATITLFLILSAVPIVMDRWPKWVTRSVAVELAREINRIKREASIERTAYRIRFGAGDGLNYSVEKIPNCAAGSGPSVRNGSLNRTFFRSVSTWLAPPLGSEMGVPGLAISFCYDYLAGNGALVSGENVVGFGIIPVNDLAEKRLDRLTLLLLTGASAEISFD
jgi:hypothetical protein